MYYICVKQSPIYSQMTLEEFLFQEHHPPTVITNETNTKTYEVESISWRFLKNLRPRRLIETLAAFNHNSATERLRESNRHDLYQSFRIPKKSGGLRKIDAPNDELMGVLRTLKEIFENDFGALYHTSAFAYIHGRSTIDAVRRHQRNESKWFLKLDLHNFFGSTTLDFVMSMLSMIFPFSEIIRDPAGRKELETALELAFLDGVLPQGTPISPLITNVMMIPIDFKLTNALRDFNGNKFVNTRYADDFIISSKHHFNFHEVEGLLSDTLRQFNAPFSLNREKTRYGSSSGSNWNLGLMLNKDNNITIGNKKKHDFQCMLTNYIKDKERDIQWDSGDIQYVLGLYNYYCMVERDTINRIVAYINEKNHVDVLKAMKDDLAMCC